MSIFGNPVMMGGSGSGGGGIIPKRITANGTYNASADNADGYNPVTVATRGWELDWDLWFEASGIDFANKQWVDSVNGVILPLDANCSLSQEGGIVISQTVSGGTSMTIPVAGSFMLANIRCKVNSDFTPKTASNWYNCSTILGTELGGSPRDWAIVINSSEKLAAGYGLSTIGATNVDICDGQFHDLTFVFPVNAYSTTVKLYYLFCDGNICGSYYYTGSEITEMTRLGVFWNYAATDTTVFGEIREIGIKYLKAYS